MTNAAAKLDPVRPDLFGLEQAALRRHLTTWGEPAYRADQVMQWVYRRGVTDFEAMTNLTKDLRSRLAETCRLGIPTVARREVSDDGTRKWLLQLDGDNAVEMVYIPEADRGTLCISSQVGCAMDCSFCATGKQGLNRNLSTAEIVGQVWLAYKELGAFDLGSRPISNVVFMGMGEPLANFNNLVPAIRILLSDHGFGLSKRRVTVSTSGLVPFIDRLSAAVDVALAISLHAPNDALRNELVPINRKYPIAELMAACRRYVQGKDRRTHIFFEYVMLAEVNDGEQHARELLALVRDLPAKVNLIPFNPFPGTDYRRSDARIISRFQDILHAGGVRTTTRRTRGDDIDAACGQLAGQVQDRQARRLSQVPLRRMPMESRP